MPKRGKQFFYASGQVSWPTIGLSQSEGGGSPYGYEWLLYEDGNGIYRQLLFKNGSGVYTPLAYEAA